MTVTETLMKPGQFALKLTDDAPRSVWQAVEMFDHLMVTPTRLEPLTSFSDANIKAAARYTGPVLSKPRGREIEGAGMAHWLGTDKGAGDLNSTTGITLTAANLTTAVNAIRPIALSAGTVTNPAGTVTQVFQWVTRREALGWVCKALGAEWRVNPDGTLDAAVPATLFTSTPTAIITRQPSGPDASYRAIQATRLEQGIDVLDYARTITVIAQLGDGAKVPAQSAVGSNLYKDFNNNNVIMERLVNAPDSTSPMAANYAATILTGYSTARKSIQLSSREYAITGFVRPGDWVWVYDVEAGLYDTANPIQFRGQTIHPVKLRCRSMTWPVQRGMGVYARRSAATPVYTDLTPWIEWDENETVWEVGTGLNDPDRDESQLSTAYLGVNPDVLQRTSLGRDIAYTPSFTGTVGGGTPGTLVGFYRVVGDRLDGYIAYTRGATDTHGAGLIAFGLPTGITAAVADGTWVGGARLVDASAGPANFMRHVYVSGGLLGMMSEAGTAVSNTVPFTIATGDQYLLQFSLKIA